MSVMNVFCHNLKMQRIKVTFKIFGIKIQKTFKEEILKRCKVPDAKRE